MKTLPLNGWSAAFGIGTRPRQSSSETVCPGRSRPLGSRDAPQVPGGAERRLRSGPGFVSDLGGGGKRDGDLRRLRWRFGDRAAERAAARRSESTPAERVGGSAGVRDAAATSVGLLKRAFVALRSRPPRGGASDTLVSEPSSEKHTGKPVAALVPSLEGRRAAKVVLVVAIGLPEEQLDAAINMALARQVADGIVTVFLTDSCAFEKFRYRRVLFEYCPPSPCSQASADDVDWDLFERRRFRLLMSKWQPLCAVALGTEARARLNQWQARGPAGRTPGPGA